MNKKNPNIKSVSIRISSNLLNELRYVADYEGVSINKQIVSLISHCVSDFELEHGEIDKE